jgi:methyl-accepting chemotaxis protein
MSTEPVVPTASVSLWGRFSLRAQASMAVLLPCVMVALVAAVYFPRKLDEQALASLEQRAVSLGTLASAQLAPAIRLVADGLSSGEYLDNTFLGFVAGQDVARSTAGAEVDLTSSDMEYIAVLKGHGDKLLSTSDNVVRKATRRSPAGTPLALPEQWFAVPRIEVRDGEKGEVPRERNRCEVTNGDLLVLRCYLKDSAGDAAEGLLVAAFRKDSLVEGARQNQMVGIWSVIIACLGGLFLALVFGRALTGPLQQVTRAAKEVASGDVTVDPIEVDAAGEVRSMASSFNEMLANLRSLVGQMVSLTGRLGEASRGLIAASGDQEHVTQQQAVYAAQIAATFEQLSRTAEQISGSTDVVETAARKTNEAVEQAQAVVRQMVAGINDIRDESKDVAVAISALNDDVQQVSRIAQVIKQVSERSDLLALNAALEGTKAGEVGRGFSLVAAEMRKLAESVSGSARDIGRIVENIRESSETAVTKAQAGVETSDRGVVVAQQASELFARILELARGTTAAAQQIAVASRQQKQSSEGAVQGARSVADLVKQGVDATGRTTRIAQDLQAVAEALSSVTKKFRVDRGS